MITTLDQRFTTFIVELTKKNNVQYTPELHSKLTESIIIGYHPRNTWENAEKVIVDRFNAINNKKVA